MTVNEIDAAELAELIDGGADVHLVDVRTAGEAAHGIIPHSEHLPLHLLPLHAEHLPAGPKLVFYCRSGARSAQACMFLQMRGRREVYNLRGGIIAWARAGLPIADAGYAGAGPQLRAVVESVS